MVTLTHLAVIGVWCSFCFLYIETSHKHTINSLCKNFHPQFFWDRCPGFRQCFVLCSKQSGSFRYFTGSNHCAGGNQPMKGLFHSICHRRVCPRSEGYRRFKTSGLCMKFHFDTLTWNRSRETCLAEDADLVVANTPKKYKSVRGYLRKQGSKISSDIGLRAWIGMRRHGNEKKYRWVQGHKTWTSWNRGDPSFQAEKCVQISTNGMGDVRCFNPRYYICEMYDAM